MRAHEYTPGVQGEQAVCCPYAAHARWGEVSEAGRRKRRTHA